MNGKSAASCATALETEGWIVHEAETMRQGLTDAGTRRPDLIILDLGLPDGDGVEFLHDLRGWSKVACHRSVGEGQRTRQNRGVRCRCGRLPDQAFSVGELLAEFAHVAAAPGRQRRSGAVFAFGDVKIDLSLRTAHKGNTAIHLTPIEYRLLSLLIANAGKVLTHRQILREVWGPAHAADGHYVRVYMGHLRQKLEDDPAQPKHILTETAVGYRLVQNARS